jgi:uncharacterized protein YdcH (DUF465 family)
MSIGAVNRQAVPFKGHEGNKASIDKSTKISAGAGALAGAALGFIPVSAIKSEDKVNSRDLARIFEVVSDKADEISTAVNDAFQSPEKTLTDLKKAELDVKKAANEATETLAGMKREIYEPLTDNMPKVFKSERVLKLAAIGLAIGAAVGTLIGKPVNNK